MKIPTQLLYHIALAKPKGSHTWLPLPGVIAPSADACVEAAAKALPKYVASLRGHRITNPDDWEVCAAEVRRLTPPPTMSAGADAHPHPVAPSLSRG